ncbi:GGDEF domain-containing protein [Massilia sp. Se16.2.3]|uniref:GGDEF domain-containing protein n=1 Tax=Massilia sp. Se16.2.3 TaxID=2709303 RepID=UPI0035A60D3C
MPEWRGTSGTAALACLNIDRFKRINEALGHLAGDAALVAVTRALEAELAPGDMLARTGNDEFALLIGTPGTPAELETRLNRLMHEVNHSVSWSGKEVAITCSIGFARFPRMATMPTACSAMRPPRCAMQKPGRRAHRAFLAWPAPRNWAGAWRSRASCGARSSVANCSCNTSRRSTCSAAGWPASRRCCAGAIRNTAWCRQRNSCRSPRKPA